MSIRSRLTLLYSTILTLTLIIFGFSLNSIQAQDTLNALKLDLSLSSNKLAEAALRTDSAPQPPQDTNPHAAPPTKPFDEFSSDQAFRDLREREIARIMDADGNLIASPFGRAEDALPLSNEGLAALQSGQDWLQDDIVSDEHMLIYSRPVIQNGETVYIVQVARSLTERDRTLQSLATTLGVAGLLTILIAFGAGWALSGLTLQPIHRITQTAEEIGDKHDFTRRVDYTGPQDEVGQLANTFNQMLTSLQDAYQKVEHSLQMQQDFVADVSHELRTPLTTLRGNLGLLCRKPSAEVQDDILVDMVDESDRLIRLVNDLLLLASADAGRSLEKESLDLSSILEESTRQAHQLDENRQINLNVSADVSILGDRDAFKQVMLILLDNALKHSDGEIDVTVRQEGEEVEVRVQDHGSGISPDKMVHVFDRFYRGEENPIEPGFGLGLPIAKSLIEGMDGIITIESEVGKGSNMVLRFAAA